MNKQEVLGFIRREADEYHNIKADIHASALEQLLDGISHIEEAEVEEMKAHLAILENDIDKCGSVSDAEEILKEIKETQADIEQMGGKV